MLLLLKMLHIHKSKHFCISEAYLFVQSGGLVYFSADSVAPELQTSLEIRVKDADVDNSG